MRVFVVRPFGVKAGIDFDRVERELIAPVVARLDLDGGTTSTVIEAGNIREDMFQLLLVSDLVIADISIDNPNVYYELGVRHALREKRTFLIRALGPAGDVPFDLRTDRYLPYDPVAPQEACNALHDALAATLASERQDSPIFRMLPELQEQGRSRFVPVPRGFREEVELAAKSDMRGKLALLAYESQGSIWESEGLRLVGREQFRSNAFEGAAVTLETLRAIEPLDTEVNLLLGTVYQRLGNPPRSEEALQRVVDLTSAPTSDRAEAWAQLGRNLKARWRQSWIDLPPARQPAHALESTLLLKAYNAYAQGFRQALNHFYPGVNALAMVTLALELARALPHVWADGFSGEEEAARAKSDLETERRALSGAVELSIQAHERESRHTGRPDAWSRVARADLTFLCGEQPGPAVRAYRDALDGQPHFVRESVRAQLQLFQALGVFIEKVARVLAVLEPAPSSGATPIVPRTILFTGHRIDAPGRPEPRFPAAQESSARSAIREVVRQEASGPSGAVGLAGAASGGDILFHEVCVELGIRTGLHLALPPEQYVRESVAPAGGDWIRRFWAIQQRCPSPMVLADSKDLPAWLRSRRDYSIWQRNNLWMLNEALANGARHVTVVALWNGRSGDGPGGTADMIAIARSRGAEVRVLDTNVLFG